jgi:hypothetical protein
MDMHCGKLAVILAGFGHVDADDLGNLPTDDSYRTPLNPDVPVIDGFHDWQDDDDDDLVTYESLDASGTREDYDSFRTALWLALEVDA